MRGCSETRGGERDQLGRGIAIRRKKLIRLPSAATPAASASATTAPSRTNEAETGCGQRRTNGLSGETGRRHDTAGAAAAARRGARHQRLQVGRLEEAKSPSAQRHAPDDIGGRGRRRQRGQQSHSEAEQRQADAAEDAGRIAVGQAARDRRHDRDHQRPRRHEQAGLDRGPMQRFLEVEGQRDERHSLHHERADGGGRRQGEDRQLEQVDGKHRCWMIGVPADQKPSERDPDHQCDPDQSDRRHDAPRC